MTGDPLVQTDSPSSLSAKRFDRYLAAGWTRSAQSFFRSKMLCLDEMVSSVVNIRLDLNEFEFRKSQRRRIRRVENDFEVVIRDMVPYCPEEQEALYQAHKDRFDGFVVDNLDYYLHAGRSESIFNTHEVLVFEGGKLLAVSFFDIGSVSMMSQLCLYDRSYPRYGLGVYTMLAEIRHAKELGLRYYYPGFVLSNPTMFDYKLELGNFHYYDWNGRWRPLRGRNYKGMLSTHFLARSQELAECIERSGLRPNWFLYPLFTYSFNHEVDWQMCPAPGFYLLGEEFGDHFLIAYYDVDTDRFVLSLTQAASYEDFSIIQPAEKNQRPIYCHKVLLIDEELGAYKTPQQLITAFQGV